MEVILQGAGQKPKLNYLARAELNHYNADPFPYTVNPNGIYVVTRNAMISEGEQFQDEAMVGMVSADEAVCVPNYSLYIQGGQVCVQNYTFFNRVCGYYLYQVG